MKEILIGENNFEKARKSIKQNKDKEIIFTSSNDELNRKVLEKENIKILLIKQKERRDRAKQRDSGFNQVMANLAKKKKVEIGIALDEILESRGKEKSQIIGRHIQNIKLCNKNKIKMKFISLSEKSKRNAHDLKAVGTVLGMPTNMIKNL